MSADTQPARVPLGGRAQAVRYVLVGAWNTVFGYGLFVLLHQLLSGTVHYIVILVVASLVAILNAFVCHRRFVFRVQGSVLLDLARFSVVYLVALAANVALLPLLVEVLGLHVLVGQALVVAGTVVASFFAHRSFSFRRPAAPVLHPRP